MEWYFEPVSGMGGAGAGAYRNTLTGAQISAAELFGREAIQNSVDAAASSGPVKVVCRGEEFRDAQLADLRRLLALDESSPVLQRSGLLNDVSISEALQSPLSALFVEDFSTVGLGGTTEPIDPTPEDNYFRLCCQLGETEEAEGRGGTFGFGKAAYWSLSSLWTIVMYSRFQPTARTNGDHARLIAVSWFKAHTHQPDEDAPPARFTGRAWAGRVASDPRGGERCLPLTDDVAHGVAEGLGFTVRDTPEATGLSLLVLGHQPDPKKLREAVEKYWWPRILEGRLEVEIGPAGRPNPRGRRDLRRFVRAWDLLSGDLTPAETDRRVPLTYYQRPLGTFAITTGDSEDSALSSPVSEDGAPRVPIALIREPRMVVEYVEGPFIGSTQPDCAGVFLADPAFDPVLAASEPPAHTTWDWKTTRTDRELSEKDRKAIQNTYRKVKSTAREFLKAHQEAPPTPPPRCRELEKELGKYLATRPEGPDPPPPPPDPHPFRVHFIEAPHSVVTPDGVVIDAKVKIVLRDDLEGIHEEVVCGVRAWVDLVVDDGRRAPRSDRLSMAFMTLRDPYDGEEKLAEEQQDRTSFVEFLAIPETGPAVVDLRSAALPSPEYRAELRIAVEAG